MIPFNIEKIIKDSARGKRKTLWGHLQDIPLLTRIGVLLVLLIVVIGVGASAFRLGTSAESIITTPVNYEFPYKGVSVHTKAENITTGTNSTNPGVEDRRGTATAKPGDIVLFTLTVNNPEVESKAVDTKFTLPLGFTYLVGSASIAPDANTDTESPPEGVLRWTGYNAPSGDSFITLETVAH